MSYYDVDQIGAIEREIYFTHIGLISKKKTTTKCPDQVLEMGLDFL